MHRSGTSILTRLLKDLGFHAGDPENFHSPDIQDPNGYWEHKDFLYINELLLSESGASWNRPDQFNIEKIDNFQLGEIEELAKSAVKKLSCHENWLVKDPRMSLTLPFWNSIVDDLNVVAIYRDPLQVAQSLSNRDSFPIQYGVAIWEYYTRALLNNTKATHFTYTYFNKLISNTEKTLIDLVLMLEEWGHPPIPKEQIIQTTHKVDARLYRATANNLTASNFLTQEQQTLHHTILDGKYSFRSHGAPSPQTEELISSVGAILAKHQNDLATLNALTENHSKEIDNLKVQNTSLRDNFSQKTNEITKLNLHCSSLTETLTAKELELQKLALVIERKSVDLDEMSSIHSKQDIEIEKVRHYAKSLETATKEATRYSQSLQSEVESTRIYITSLEDKIEKLKLEETNYKNYIASLKDEIEKKEEESLHAHTEFQRLTLEKDEYTESLKTESRERSTYINSLRAERENIEEYVRSLEQEVKKVTAYANSLEQNSEKTS